MVKKYVLALTLVGALSACQSTEEKAENYYQSAVKLIDGGDVDRGLVELRNVFRYDGQHHDARALYARTVRARGDLKEAYGQYLRLAEQYPDDPAAALALTEISLATGRGEEGLRYAGVLRRIHPDLAAAPAEVQAAVRAVDFAAAAQKKDSAGMAEAAAAAVTLLRGAPDLALARQVVIAENLSQQRWEAARDEIAAGLAAMPSDAAALGAEDRLMLRRLYEMRLGVLQQLGDKVGFETGLKEMIAYFPDETALQATLLRWYVSEGRLDDAEAWLRARIAAAGADPEPRITLVQFLAELRGGKAALAELDTVLAQDPLPADVVANAATFRGQRANLRYLQGDRAAAVTEMRDVIKAAEGDGTTAAQIDRLRIGLAKMEVGLGNQVGARQLVETVLSHDATNIDAMKLKGNWLIDDDKTGDALVVLRAALGQAPRDPELMTLMARAYEREGNRDLMAEMLARAVELSSSAPETSLRYANFLLSDKKLRSAEDVLIDALRLAPADVQLLAALGRTHVAMKDWARAEQDVSRLRELAPEQMREMADQLQAQIFAGQNRTEDLSQFLTERGAAQGEGSLAAEAAVIQANIVAGKLDAALSRSEALMAKLPDDPGAKYVRATVLSLARRDQEAAGLLEDVVAAQPRLLSAWQALVAVQTRRGDLDAAGAVLDRAEATLGEDPTVKMLRASWLEARGDLEGAIAIYQALYDQRSDNIVVANNLASLLTTARNDDESLSRAYTIARRLRGLAMPAFQDTYGWIAFRRGDMQEALAALEPAAAGLRNDPQVQFHLGQVYAALGRADEARGQYDRAAQLIPAGSNPAMETRLSEARAALEAAPAAGAPAAAGTKVGQ
ncbi:tetratricopeptide repeat protein [Frigidibacter sp. MR17.14]|uniref:tetratricopeptide repeat protein n=1 Tax=Frigidibacter sp. MR17.14 TaxID=3126509 RepID=UPI003012B9A8